MADPHALPGFGEVDLDLGDDGEDAPPASTSRASGHERVAKPTVRRNDDEPIPEEARAGEETRIVASNAISAYTRSNPPPGKSIGEQPTRMGSLDDLVAQSRDASASESGIATRDDRVAAMREAYARGDAAAALELAESMRGEPGVTMPPTGDHPDASICVQVAGEVEIEEAYGGLIPIEEGTVQLEIERVSEAPAEGVDVVRSALTLTERQSIPRVVLGPAELGKLPIDGRGGFLLSQVDGMQTLEEILDVCAMPAEEALAVFDQLKSLGVIEFE